MTSQDPELCLPPALAERTRLVGRKSATSTGQYVLYWMRTAIRAEENPALNVAIEFANGFDLPLLVYQGLTERYPFASDRHHTFVLQAARDVQRSFADGKATYLLHVERPGHRGPHLKTLAQRAAVVITEDMPTEPLRSWTSRLSRVVECNLYAVDTACVVPMQLVGKSYERAFAFRDATRTLYAERVSFSPEESDLKKALPSSVSLPFEPVNLQGIEIASLVSQCEIDHSIGPVTHTRGGSAAGYDRWQRFKSKGLSSYSRLRNNALVDGVSRMSPYLHYGMVAPTRIAREAAAEVNKGAEKFLGELLVWRELAYVFCHYRRDHGRVSAIPNWARASLHDHECDSRELLSWETMCRGRTGDSIWDSAQRSLLIHGELHNNVRMTWGKSVLAWTPDSRRALARLIDLNHRYALDGRDPASYGGMLWCLGQFDRPFEPSQPVFGKVRTRSTQQQASRLDPSAYRRKVTRPLWDQTPRVAVVGAGISGLICARTLADHGCDVRVYEKSRGFGGRMSTRCVDDKLSFDHGAPAFTARDKRFKRYVRSWVDDGYVALWNGRIAIVEKGVIKGQKRSGNHYVAVPGMSSLGKHLASDLDVQLETRVAAPMRRDDKWLLGNDVGDELGQFDAVVIAVPSHQAEVLLANSPELAEQSSNFKMLGCWALMLAFEESLGLRFDRALSQESSLSWISRDNSKPGRSEFGETWVAHATHAWSAEHMDDSREQVSQCLLNEFWTAVGRRRVEPIHVDAHLWRFANPDFAVGTDHGSRQSADSNGSSLAIASASPSSRCLLDDETLIGACGDWCGVADVEGAFLSGIAVAGRILGRLNRPSAAASKDKAQLSLF